jgi:hypothetical protein
MLYTLAQVAKAADLRESTILRAIEGGQITGTKDLFGQWHVEDTELHRLYPLMAERNASRDAAHGYAAPDPTTMEGEIGAVIREAGDSLREQRDDSFCHAHTGGDQAQASQNLLAEPHLAALAWGHGLRIDDRDKFLISAPPACIRRTRIARTTGALIIALGIGWIGGFSSNYFLGPSPVSTPVERKLNSSAPILGSENQMVRVTPAETRRAATAGLPNTGKSATAAGNGIARRDEMTHSIDQVLTAPTNKPPTAAQQNTTISNTAAAASARRAKIPPKPIPVPETRPTTIEGWRVHDVVDGTAVLEGPNGMWKAARGDMVPGLGRVDSIVLWGSRWIVSTSRGLISTQ